MSFGHFMEIGMLGKRCQRAWCVLAAARSVTNDETSLLVGLSKKETAMDAPGIEIQLRPARP
jgi:hypothetical protein